MIARLTILSCLLAIAHSRFVEFDFQVPLLGSRIIGGHDAEEGEFPHQVSLQIGVPGRDLQHFCGGSIIKNNWIVTAVHCLDAVDELKAQVPNIVFVIKAGKLDQSTIEDTEQLAQIDSYFKHEKYIGGKNRVGPFDIGLIKLKTPLMLNKRVAAIALPVKDSDPTGEVVLSGWGAINSDHEKPEYPLILQTVTIPVIKRDDCNAAIKKIAEEMGQIVGDMVHETNICTGPLTGGISACGGDSGGPLIAKNKNDNYELVGVVSWGLIPCGRNGAPSVFVRVASFIDWMENIMSR